MLLSEFMNGRLHKRSNLQSKYPYHRSNRMDIMIKIHACRQNDNHNAKSLQGCHLRMSAGMLWIHIQCNIQMTIHMPQQPRCRRSPQDTTCENCSFTVHHDDQNEHCYQCPDHHAVQHLSQNLFRLSHIPPDALFDNFSTSVYIPAAHALSSYL